MASYSGVSRLHQQTAPEASSVTRSLYLLLAGRETGLIPVFSVFMTYSILSPPGTSGSSESDADCSSGL